MKILVERPQQRRAGKYQRKTRKLLKKMAKLESKLKYYDIADSDNASSDESSASSCYEDDEPETSQRRHCGRRARRLSSRSLSSCDSDASSSSSSSGRSTSPQPRGYEGHQQHVSRSRSFAGRENCSPSRRHRHQHLHQRHRHHHHQQQQHRHHSPRRHRDFQGKYRHQHSRRRQQDDEVEGCSYRFMSEPNLPEMTAELSIAGDRQGPVSAARSATPAEQTALNQQLEMEEDLQEIGHDDQDRQCAGPKIDENLANAWTEILRSGEAADKMQSLLNKYPLPENCTPLNGPRLNREIYGLVSLTAVRRDGLCVQQQNKIGAALVALSRALRNQQESEGEPSVAEAINDATTILLDAHHDMTKARQSFVMTDTGRRARALLASCKADELLFGKELAEKDKRVRCFGKYRRRRSRQRSRGREDRRCEKRKHDSRDAERRKSKRLEASGNVKK